MLSVTSGALLLEQPDSVPIKNKGNTDSKNLRSFISLLSCPASVARGCAGHLRRGDLLDLLRLGKGGSPQQNYFACRGGNPLSGISRKTHLKAGVCHIAGCRSYPHKKRHWTGHRSLMIEPICR